MAFAFVMPLVHFIGLGGSGGRILVPIVKLFTRSPDFILAYRAHRLSSSHTGNDRAPV